MQTSIVEPVETKWARLGDVATIDRKSIAPENIPDGTTYVGLENIVSGGEFLRVGPVENGELASQKFVFDANHILYGKLRPYLAKIAMPNFAGICSTDILPVRAGALLDKRFLAFFLRQNWVVDQVNGLTSGANLPRISPKSLESIEVPIFPMTYQRRIAAILDKADHLRTQRREALAHLDALTQSIFNSMFETKSFPISTLAAVCSVINDCPHSTPNWAATGVTCLRTSNLRYGEWNWDDHRFVSDEEHHLRSKRGYLEPGDIVLSREGTVGVLAIVPHGMKASMGQRLVQIRANMSVENRYLLHLLLKDLAPETISHRMVGATSRHLNVRDLRALPIPVPPLELQKSFARRIAGVERLKEQHRTQLAELDTLFASLQHRAFSGLL